MLGGYIGQFLPLAGGTLTGTLNLGGLDLDYAGNVKDSDGNTRIQIINTGSNRALNFCDDTGFAAMTVAEGMVQLSSTVQLYLGGGLNFDSIADVYADGSGNVELDCTTLLISPAVTGSSGTISGSAFGAALSVSGSVTAIGTVFAPSFSGSTTGKKYIAGFGANAIGGFIASYIDTNGNFIKSTFTAAQAIYVDGTNGSDMRGNGTNLAPYATIAHALSVATPGQCVFVGPGTYNCPGQIVLPNGVSLSGCGIGVTTIQNTGVASTPGLFVVLGTGSVVENVTINAINGTNNVAPIGFNIGAGAGSTQTSTAFTLRNCDFTGRIDGLYLNSGAGNGNSTVYTCDDCWFRSNYDTTQHATTGTWTFNGTFLRCQFITTYNGVSSTMRSLAGANCTIYCEDCDFINNDTSSSPHNAQFISMSGVEVKGCRFVQNTPNLSQPYIPYLANQADAGNVFIAILSGGTSVFEIPQTFSSPSVSSSAVTPPLASFSEIAVDAGTLTSNTLTVNPPPFNTGTGATVADFTKVVQRIKNTNSGSTAMILSFAAGYDLGSSSAGTIAAGKKAYLTFQYDQDNSKWDLTGYANGL
ncbi:MAG: DUF1565 domain-containing protein [Tepidisphaeraceae bacterium]